jgi:anti-sigma B factor antagonist
VGTVAAMPSDFELTSAYLGGGASVVTVAGELDVMTAPALRDEISQVADEGAQEIVVDLLKVPFIDSIGLGILVEASKRAQSRGGVFRVVCDDRRIARIIEITGLDRVLRVHPTLRGALEALDQQRPVPAVGA